MIIIISGDDLRLLRLLRLLSLLKPMEMDCKEDDQAHEEKQNHRVARKIGESRPPVRSLFLMKFEFVKI
jgi:hypothetical protein